MQIRPYGDVKRGRSYLDSIVSTHVIDQQSTGSDQYGSAKGVDDRM